MSSIITTNRNSTITAPTYTSTSTTARNSASISSQIAALETKHTTSDSAECTGLREMMTPSAAITRNAANNQKRPVISIGALSLAVRRVSNQDGAEQRNETHAHGQELVLAHDVLAAILH